MPNNTEGEDWRVKEGRNKVKKYDGLCNGWLIPKEVSGSDGPHKWKLLGLKLHTLKELLNKDGVYYRLLLPAEYLIAAARQTANSTDYNEHYKAAVALIEMTSILASIEWKS